LLDSISTQNLMTIEQLAEQATDEENFSRDGEVVVHLPNLDMTVSVTSARYDEEKKQLVLVGSVSRQ
jgi:hypothetical protein